VLTNPDHALTNALGQRPRAPGRAPNIDSSIPCAALTGKPLIVEAAHPKSAVSIPRWVGMVAKLYALGAGGV
jgi:hypothetical protein